MSSLKHSCASRYIQFCSILANRSDLWDPFNDHSNPIIIHKKNIKKKPIIIPSQSIHIHAHARTICNITHAENRGPALTMMIDYTNFAAAGGEADTALRTLSQVTGSSESSGAGPPQRRGSGRIRAGTVAAPHRAQSPLAGGGCVSGESHLTRSVFSLHALFFLLLSRPPGFDTGQRGVLGYSRGGIHTCGIWRRTWWMRRVLTN
jgi:hypothetical protein